MVLDVTTRDGRGEVVFSARKEYVQYGQDIDGDLRYGAWQIKKFTDFTLQPFQMRTERFVIPLAEGTKQAEVEMALTYLHPGAKTEVPIHRVVRKLDIRE